MMMRLTFAILSFAMLIAVDWFLLAVAFLYGPASSEWIGVFGLISFSIAITLRLGWLMFATHNIVSAILLIRLVQYYQSDLRQEEPTSFSSSIAPLVAILFSNFLVWLVVRGFPERSWLRGSKDTHSAGR